MRSGLRLGSSATFVQTRIYEKRFQSKNVYRKFFHIDFGSCEWDDVPKELLKAMGDKKIKTFILYLIPINKIANDIKVSS